ncbi:3-demethylubiquinone-9 3-methyltransferase [hydrothermal vent metagenome]|uniref:3-demethylubiquinone-9 3-methyltransferase n=1 Tax=hydrothermal vent metagenome TaxID=652676 RepID=A0A3B1BXN9_9ZZZZ
MQERHLNRNKYFDEQVYTTEKYVIPFISDVIAIDPSLSVLEIGCGEGGNLKPFLDIGCKTTGVDLSEKKIENGKRFFSDHPNKDNLTLIAEDIYRSKSLEQYDLIIMRDVIEHIHDQEKFMSYVKKYLKPGAKFFLAFPPWYNPFGGHQQICKNKILSVMPYYHILPRSIYSGILKSFNEEQERIEGLLEIKETGITIERFQKILADNNYKIDKKTFYFINPNYEIKFGVKPRKQLGLISSIPGFRNFVTTSCYYIVSLK